MEIGAVIELVERVAARPVGPHRAAALCAAADLQKIRSWVDAQEVAVARDLAACASAGRRPGRCLPRLDP